MNYRSLLRQLAIAISVVAVANVGIARLARHSIPRQLLAKAERAEPATDLFLGNSTMACGVDELAFAESVLGHRPLNLGLMATYPVEHLLIYRRQEKHAGAAVYYGYFDRQLTAPPTARPESLLGNRAMSYYVDPPLAYDYYSGDSSFRMLGFHLAGFFPAYVERAAVWGRVERLRRQLGGVGLPKADENRFGRVADFDFLQESTENFSLGCQTAVRDRTPLSAPISSILQAARSRRSTIYFIEMPMSGVHRKLYNSNEEWLAYRKYLAELIREVDAIDIPAGDWVSEDGFADAIHMNERGARTFSSKLGESARNHR